MNIRHQIVVSLLALCGVTFIAWLALFSYAATTGNRWAMIHLAGMVATSLIGVQLSKLERRMEESNGDHRRTGTEVYSNPGQRAVTGDTGTIALQGADPAVARPRRRTCENTGIVLGEIEAFRCWRVVGDHLASMNGVIWVPSEPMSGEEVEPDNSNGVHAFKDAAAAERYCQESVEIAVGRVKLWGQIVEHETGYRAQYARPVSITRASSEEKRRRIHARYGLGE